MTEKVKLGSTYRDKIHGIVGIAAYRTECLTGCSRVCLQYVKEGEIKECWFDEPQLELHEEKKVEPVEKDDRGGPGGEPPSRGVPPSR